MSLQQTLWVFFGFSGRLGRQAFALAGLLLYVIRLYPMYRLYAVQGDEEAMTYWASAFLITLCVLIVSHLALAAKRLHDFDKSGWFSLLFIIGDIFAYLLLCLPRGTGGPNRYGPRTDAPA
ncbi:DUF805 domain-containing protein [Mesorhizobium sp. CN5-321]|uniref:DUF805 domain-containing protein n=1 Tax=Mesorhizobium hunchu TaxID=3157708 RepID=UPI0032B7DF24